ncbi:MAG: hypothetical protein V3U09_07730, partial [Thermoplasmata archaeon]
MARRKGILRGEQEDIHAAKGIRKGARAIVEKVLGVHEENRRNGTFLSNRDVLDELHEKGIRHNIKSIGRAHKNLMEQRLLEKGPNAMGYAGYRLIPVKERDKRVAIEDLLSGLQEFDVFEDEATRLETDCDRLRQLLADDKKSKKLLELLHLLKEKSKEVFDAKRAATEMIGSFLSSQLNLSLTKSEKIEANKINEIFCRHLLRFLLTHNLGLAWDGERFFDESGSTLRRRPSKGKRTEEDMGSVVEFWIRPRFLPIEEIRASNEFRIQLGQSIYRDIYEGKMGPSRLIAVLSGDDVLLSVYDKEGKGIPYLKKLIRETIDALFRLSRPELDELR